MSKHVAAVAKKAVSPKKDKKKKPREEPDSKRNLSLFR